MAHFYWPSLGHVPIPQPVVVVGGMECSDWPGQGHVLTQLGSGEPSPIRTAVIREKGDSVTTKKHLDAGKK